MHVHKREQVNMQSDKQLQRQLQALAGIMRGDKPMAISAGRQIGKGKKRRKKTPEEKYLIKKFKKLKLFKNQATDKMVRLTTFRIKPARKKWKKWNASRKNAWGKLHEKYLDFKKEFMKKFRQKHKGMARKHQTMYTHLSPVLVKRNAFLVKNFKNDKFDMGDGKGERPLKDIIKEMKANPAENAAAYKGLLKKVDTKRKKDRRSVLKSMGDQQFPNKDGSTSSLKEIVAKAIKSGDAAAYKRVMKAATKQHESAKQQKSHSRFVEKFEKKEKGRKSETIDKNIATLKGLLGAKFDQKGWQKKVKDAENAESPGQATFLLIQEARSALQNANKARKTIMKRAPKEYEPPKKEKKAPPAGGLGGGKPPKKEKKAPPSGGLGGGKPPKKAPPAGGLGGGKPPKAAPKKRKKRPALQGLDEGIGNLVK